MTESQLLMELIQRVAALEARISQLESATKKIKKPKNLKPRGAIESLQHPVLSPYLVDVSHDLQMTLVELYGGDASVIQAELLNAVSWLKANESRSPKKDFGRFFRNWIDRWWAKKRTQNVVPLKGWSAPSLMFSSAKDESDDIA